MYRTKMNNRLINRDRLREVALAVLPTLLQQCDSHTYFRGDAVDDSLMVAEMFFDAVEERYEGKRSKSNK